jgi:uncharacterized membrane protein YedE/YeeE
MNIAFAFLAGLIFGVGLLISGMTNPAKVLGFLDLAGAWDPSLALVMAGAIGVAVAGFALAKRRQNTWLDLPILLPVATHIDRRLIGGSALFGVGWGLAGICPGPAVVLLGTASGKGTMFFVAMLAGMGVFEWMEHIRHSPK